MASPGAGVPRVAYLNSSRFEAELRSARRRLAELEEAAREGGPTRTIPTAKAKVEKLEAQLAKQREREALARMVGQ